MLYHVAPIPGPATREMIVTAPRTPPPRAPRRDPQRSRWIARQIARSAAGAVAHRHGVGRRDRAARRRRVLAGLIRLLAPFGINERLVRTSVFRLAQRRLAQCRGAWPAEPVPADARRQAARSTTRTGAFTPGPTTIGLVAGTWSWPTPCRPRSAPRCAANCLGRIRRARPRFPAARAERSRHGRRPASAGRGRTRAGRAGTDIPGRRADDRGGRAGLGSRRARPITASSCSASARSSTASARRAMARTTRSNALSCARC